MGKDEDYIKIDLSKVLTRADQVTIGEEYYLFNNIDCTSLEIAAIDRDKIVAITDDEFAPFDNGVTAFTFAYPIPEEKTRYFTYEEIFKVWKDNPYRIWSIPKYELHGIITAFDDTCKSFTLCETKVFFEKKDEDGFKHGTTIEDIRDYKGEKLIL